MVCAYSTILSTASPLSNFPAASIPVVLSFSTPSSPGFNQNQIKEVVLDPVLVILGFCGETTAVLVA